MAKVNFNIEQIKAAASKTGADTNMYYLTTLDRYNEQLKIMSGLKLCIEENGSLVTKEYVKGRQNLVVNPAISEYNRTASAANNTVQTLIKIVQAVGLESITDVDAMTDEL